MKPHYPDASWSSDPEGRYSFQDEGRWQLSDRENAAWAAVAGQWRTDALLGLPVDDAAVREAIAFAYMMADLEPPKTIESVAGPRDGMRRAWELGCSYAWRRFVPDNRRDNYDLAGALQDVGGLDFETAFDDVCRITRWTDRRNAILDAMLVDLGSTDERTFSEIFCDAALGDFLMSSNLLPDAGWEGMKRLLFACGPWWWAGPDAFIVCQAPSHLAFDASRLLHDETNPALVYPDGTQVHAWHGRRIPPRLLESRDAITVADIAREPNIELRRVMIHMYGEARYVLELGATLVVEDRWGKLWRGPPLPDEREDVLFVEVRNATAEPDGSVKTYFLRVPPMVRTPREAIAWTFDLGEYDYAPAVET